MCVITKGLYSCLLLYSVIGVKGLRARECGPLCSRTLAPVCARVTAGLASDVRVYHNACHLNKIRCLLKRKLSVTVAQLPDHVCGLDEGTQKAMDGRRYVDHTIVGARNFCNHTCPTHCTDIYEPVCAQLYDRNSVRRRHRVLVNHCHADLLSCALQQTVRIQTLDYCLGAMTQFAYASLAQAAVLKKLGLFSV